MPALAFMPTRLEPEAVFILGRPVATCVRLHPAFDQWETGSRRLGQLRWALDCPKGSAELARFGIVIMARKRDEDPTCEAIERDDVVYLLSLEKSPLAARRYGNLSHSMIAAEWLADQGQGSARTETGPRESPLPLIRPVCGHPSARSVQRVRQDPWVGSRARGGGPGGLPPRPPSTSGIGSCPCQTRTP